MISRMCSGLIKSKQKVLLKSIFSRVTLNYDRFENFLRLFFRFTVSLAEEILVRKSMSKF